MFEKINQMPWETVLPGIQKTTSSLKKYIFVNINNFIKDQLTVLNNTQFFGVIYAFK